MNFISTRGGSPPTPFEAALFRGLAPDGGLYMPETVPTFPREALSAFSDKGWPQIANLVLGSLLQGAVDAETVQDITADAFDFPMPLIQLHEDIHVLELYRGPTLAFKDIGARFMARLLGRFHRDTDSVITVLTATSGDTGGAVAHAFHGLPGIRVVVLFPDGKVTPRQELQFSTLGGNVTAVAVQGDFDDCQRITKEAFQGAHGLEDLNLTSANSINLGRFLPQATYFFEVWARLAKVLENRTNILFSVPSGNFGNMAAGLLAKKMGLPDATFLAATNMNDVVPEYLRVGSFTARPSVRTLSTAMDVGNPSNLDRITHLYGGEVKALGKDLVARKVTDAETLDCIRRVHEDSGYVLDPHSAVGYSALEKEMEGRPGTRGVLLATAHPAKFSEVVEPALGKALPVPEELSQCLEAERQVIPMEPRLESLVEILV